VIFIKKVFMILGLYSMLGPFFLSVALIFIEQRSNNLERPKKKKNRKSILSSVFL
jgi:hypothetical protein